jgi:hypothetical protein
MNTEMRVISVEPRPSSRGGTAGPTADPEQHRGEIAEEQRARAKGGNERIAFAVDRNEGILDRVDEAHWMELMGWGQSLFQVRPQYRKGSVVATQHWARPRRPQPAATATRLPVDGFAARIQATAGSVRGEKADRP